MNKASSTVEHIIARAAFAILCLAASSCGEKATIRMKVAPVEKVPQVSTGIKSDDKVKAKESIKGTGPTSANSFKLTVMSNESLIKNSPKDSSELSESEKCVVSAGAVVEGEGVTGTKTGHQQITSFLRIKNKDGKAIECKLDSYWIYRPHFSGEVPGENDGSVPAVVQKPMNSASSPWVDLGAENPSSIQKLKAIIDIDSEWSIDIRVITPVKKYTVLKHRGDLGYIPASTNKITSAIGAHLNAGKSWADMTWWILESNNDAAERAWDDAGQRTGVLKALKSIGVEPPLEWKNVDGSGLSYNNSIPATFLINLLLAVKEQPWYQAFQNSLPTSCKSGTMASMFCESADTKGNIHAKTGTLNTNKGVKGLAGFGLTKSGNLLVFTTLYNGPPETAWTKGNDKIQAIVTEAVRIAESLN